MSVSSTTRHACLFHFCMPTPACLSLLVRIHMLDSGAGVSGCYMRGFLGYCGPPIHPPWQITAIWRSGKGRGVQSAVVSRAVDERVQIRPLDTPF